MNEENEISPVDLLLVVAENIKLLIFGPLLVGLVALGIAYALPQSFTSQTHLVLGDSAKVVEAMMRAPTVLDVVLKQFPSPLGITDSARNAMARKLHFSTVSAGSNATTDVTKLEVEDEVPARAQALANAFIDAWLATTKPPPERALELTRKLKLSQEGLDTVNQLLTRMAGETTKLIQPNVQYELGTQAIQLLQMRNGYADAIAAIKLEMQGVTRDVVVSPPSLPTEATKPHKSLIAVLAAIGSGFALLLWVFMRQAWRNAAQAPETSKKQAQLRATLGRPRA
jgi:LPS O-antigen subunit length determinant protein (WzzB/FepE family)